MIALFGNLSLDRVDGGPPTAGGGPYHGARALQHLDVEAQITARCAPADRGTLLPPLLKLGTPVDFIPGTSTATFTMSYNGDHRTMEVESQGDTWQVEDLHELPAAVTWVHVAPLARSDFPPETLAVLAKNRQLSFDGQGLVRAPGTGPLKLNDSYDPELLRHIKVLKLAEEEAEILGDPADLPVREVIVTRGARGALVYVDGREERVSVSPQGGNPTGAGDAFIVAYIAARSGGVEPVAAARSATNLVATLMRDS